MTPLRMALYDVLFGDPAGRELAEDLSGRLDGTVKVAVYDDGSGIEVHHGSDVVVVKLIAHP